MAEPTGRKEHDHRKLRAKACVICNKRKIRCKPSEDGGPCESCLAYGYECRPRQRKRRHYHIVDEPEDEETPIKSSRAPVPIEPEAARQALHQVQTPEETAEFFQAALNAQFGSSHRGLEIGVHRPSSQHVQMSVASSPSDAATATAGFLGRSKYLGRELQVHEAAVVEDGADVPHSTLTEDDWKVLQLRRAFELPSRAVCESLISTFIEKCHPWMPVVDDDTLARLQQGNMSSTPLLLLQALFMAGSRMRTTSSALEEATVQDYYNRAKVLFFSNYEKDPMTLVTAVTILQYWNPTGPEHVSIHNSSYWMRVGVGLAYQIGLHREPDPKLPDFRIRRRVFWTLFARDSLLSAGQGRPRAVHIDDCSISWPTENDFVRPDKRAHLFVAYVKIASILGDLTQWYLRGCIDAETRSAAFERDIHEWIQNLPTILRVRDDAGRTRPYDSEVRQLYLPYFTAISILYKPKPPSKLTGCSQATIGSTLASSCVARIFEDALARGEVRNGVAMHAIYLLIAGIGELSNYDYPLLWQASRPELKVITFALQELSKTWQTAKGTLQVFERLQQTVSSFRAVPNPPALQPMSRDLALFEPFGADFCSKWPIVIAEWSLNPMYRDLYGVGTSPTPAPGQGETENQRHPDATPRSLLPGQQYNLSPSSMMSTLLDDLAADSLYSSGSWILQDF